jgi:metal-dependent amidase/aminoacylase/carboxypeptidase family protein
MEPNHTNSSLPDRAPFKVESGKVREILHDILTDWTWDEFYDGYKDLHKHPGVSGKEKFAADKAKEFLRQIQSSVCYDGSSYQGTFDVIPDIGNAGPSVVGVMMNPSPSPEAGLRPRFTPPEPVVLLRADMDALPIQETTG